MVTILTPGFWGEGLTRSYMLAQALRVAGHEVEIVGCIARSGVIYPEPPPGLRLVPVPTRSLPSLYASIRKCVRGEVIYAVKPYSTSFGIALLEQLRSRRPLLLDIDDWAPGFLPPFSAAALPADAVRWLRHFRTEARALLSPHHRIYRRVLHRLAWRADALTVNTRFLQARYGGVYVPSAKDTELFDPACFDADAVRRKLGLAGYRVLMFPGTALPHKGLEDVLTAVQRLNWPDLRLVIVGGRADPTGYLRGLLERWGKWIVHLPPQPAARMPEVVAAAHAVVIAQRDTPVARAQLPMKLTDAMAMAKPVIATAVGDIPEVLQGTGWLAPSSAPSLLAARIEAVFRNPAEAAARGARARQRCVEHYSITAIARTLSGVLAPYLPATPPR